MFVSRSAARDLRISLKKPAPKKAVINHVMSRLGLAVLAVLLMISLCILPALAAPGPVAPDQEAILKPVRALLDEDETSSKNLKDAALTLEASIARFPREPRFPLYLAEAYYRMADPEAEVAGEFHFYEKAALYAQQALKLDPGQAAAHYWNGLCLLKKAQKKGGVGAYFLAKEGIKELEEVRRTLPSYDHAGAARVLTLLYCVAPKWTPFGDLDKSIEMGQEAIRLAPDHALNRLYLADAYNKRGDKADAIREYRALLAAASRQPGPQAAAFSQKAKEMLRALGDAI